MRPARDFRLPIAAALAVLAAGLTLVPARRLGAQGRPSLKPPPTVFKPSAEALAEAERSVKMIKLPKGVTASVWAAEPLLENAVSFAFDEKGRAYVAETFRVHKAILDTRSRGKWPSEAFRKSASPERMKNILTELLDGDLAAQTVEDRERMIKTYFAGDLERFTDDSEIVKQLLDTDGDGRADHATVFADHMNGLLDGTISGVLARRGDVFVTDIPALIRFRDLDGDGAADRRDNLSTGYGVRWAFFGHDMHGLRIGPDGRLYFSFGDRGASVKTKEGATLAVPETGAVFRCDLDGSHLELFHKGLRNPQELAFDEHGNLFTGDNNSDGGDKARIVYLVEGGDSGWRQGLQNLEEPRVRGPWLQERWSFPHFDGQAAFLVPPLFHLASGPAGLTYHPGTGSPSRFKNHFFLADFRGQASSSGVWSFQVAPAGAGFRVLDPQQFAWGVLATDVDFGPDGSLYLLDWVAGWDMTGKGRIYRVTDTPTPGAPVARPIPVKPGPEINEYVAAEAEAMAHLKPSSASVSDLIWADLRSRALADHHKVAPLLRHPDTRVRQAAQFGLAEIGDANAFAAELRDPGATPLSRVHAVWGLGQIVRRKTPLFAEPYGKIAGVDPIFVLRAQLTARDPEVRGQSARALADGGVDAAAGEIARLLQDSSPRARFFAAIGLGKLGAEAARASLVKMIADNDDRDPFLRHAGIVGLAGLKGADLVAALRDHKSRAVRLAAVVVLRRLHDARVAGFLDDGDVLVAREAARAINDEPMESATTALAALADGSRHLGDDAVLTRVVAANMRLGSETGARRLAALASSASFSALARRDAVAALGDWVAPLPRNRVIGIHQAFSPPKRDPAAARAALGSALPKLFAVQDKDDKTVDLQSAAAVAAATLGLREGAPLLDRVVRARDNAARLRLAALQALDDLDATELAGLLPVTADDPDQSIRMTALRMRVKREPAKAVQLAQAALHAASVVEKQAAIGILAGTPGPAADAVVMGLVDGLLAGSLPPELTLDVIEAAAARPTKPFQDKLAAFDARRPKDETGAFLEVMAGGDASRGRRVFTSNDQVQCRRCHSLEGHGVMAGPGLESIGRAHDRTYLLEAILTPSKHFAPGFESVLVTMKTGALHGGTLKSETTKELALETVDEGNIKVEKSLIAERQRGVSAMPEGFALILSKRELRDLIEFLAQQKK